MKKIIFTSLLVCSFNVFATGQGGIAGSSSMIMNTGIVTDVSASIAIGKTSAHSSAKTTDTIVSTFAGGAGGILTTDANGDLVSIGVEDATNLAADQTNAINNGTVDLNAKTGAFTGQATTP